MKKIANLIIKKNNEWNKNNHIFCLIKVVACLPISLSCGHIHVHFFAPRFMLKRTKPGLVSSNSSARLLEDVLADRDNYDHLIQGSRVRQQVTCIQWLKRKKMLTIYHARQTYILHFVMNAKINICSSLDFHTQNIFMECANDRQWPPLTSVFQYYYSVRVLPGQEPFDVWVGWVTSNFHQHNVTFDADRVRTVTVTLGDDCGKVRERLVSSSEHMTWQCIPHRSWGAGWRLNNLSKV